MQLGMRGTSLALECLLWNTWPCIPWPLVVEVFGGWGNEAINVFSTLSKKVATRYADLYMRWYQPSTVASSSPS